jgi:hypothetical protein
MLLKSVANFFIRDLLLDKLECARIAGALAADQELFRSKALCGHFQKVPAGLGEWKVIKHINRHSSIEKKHGIKRPWINTTHPNNTCIHDHT